MRQHVVELGEHGIGYWRHCLLVDADIGSGGDISSRQGLKHNGGVQSSKSGATDILASVQSTKAELCTLAEDIYRKVLVLIPLWYHQQDVGVLSERATQVITWRKRVHHSPLGRKGGFRLYSMYLPPASLGRIRCPQRCVQDFEVLSGHLSRR
jgi:hypothetical protein